MNKQVADFFEKVTNEYSLILLNWAYKKLGDRAKAEDLAQEVLVQVFAAIKKDLSHDKPIEKIENLIWKIAHYVWCCYLRRNEHFKMCVPIDDLQLEDESDFAKEYADDENEKQLILCMRKRITRLNYLQREILISFYIDKLSVKRISNKLSISESAVKWHLFDTRKKLKREIITMSTNNYVYRPHKLHMGISGQSVAVLDTNVINESLTKQNICIACYKVPKNLDELTEMLGIPKAYIEDDLKWLVEREFIGESSGKYSTLFIIDSAEEEQGKYAIYLNHKDTLSNVIINELIAAEERIRKVGFYGSDKPLNELLWLLIYRCVNCIKCADISMEKPIRPDGGSYFPLGFDRTDLNLTKMFIDTSNWAYNGAMCSDNFWWFGLYDFGKSEIENLIDGFSTEWRTLHELLCKTINSEFDISAQDDDEKLVLSKLVQKGFVTIDNSKVLPNFCVFTSVQYQQLEETVFVPIAEKLSNEISALTKEFEEYYKKNIPPQLNDYSQLFVQNALQDIGYLTTLFAFNDKQLYLPKDKHDGEFLTFMYISSTPFQILKI